MLKRFIHSLLLRRHFWRYATFSEIAELYASRMLRMLAVALSGTLISIYLYQTGYSLAFIGFFWAVYFGISAVAALPMAALVAWIGPKHAILWSNIAFIPVMVAFALLPEFGPWLLLPIVIVQSVSAVLYGIAYQTTFSKVKSLTHAGKELAYMNIFEKITVGLSPLIGGFLAFLLGPQAVLVIAGIIFLLAAVPLMQSGEPTRRHQRLSFVGFPWRLMRRTATAHYATGYDAVTSGGLWGLFVAITIIGIQATNEVYAISGLLVSIGVFAAIGASYAFGKLIDNRRGWELLKVSIVVNALAHTIRPFIGTPVAAAGLNAGTEAVTSGYMMAYQRGVFDNADLSGMRIVYIGIGEVVSCLGAATSALVLGITASIFTELQSFQIVFFVTAAVVLLVLTAKFPLYRRT